jgi:hypothetical protein
MTRTSVPRVRRKYDVDKVYTAIVALRGLGFKVKKSTTQNKHVIQNIEVTTAHLLVLAQIAKDVLSRATECKEGPV